MSLGDMSQHLEELICELLSPLEQGSTSDVHTCVCN